MSVGAAAPAPENPPKRSAPAPENPLKRSAPAPEPQESRYPLRKRRKIEYSDHLSYISDSDFTDDDMVLNPDEEVEDEADSNEESTSHGEDDESTSHDECILRSCEIMLVDLL